MNHIIASDLISVPMEGLECKYQLFYQDKQLLEQIYFLSIHNIKRQKYLG